MGLWVKDKDVEAEKKHYSFLKYHAKDDQWCIKYLYDRLNIIDSKIGAILRLNGIGIGFMSVLVFQILRSLDGCQATAAIPPCGIAQTASCQPLVAWPGVFLAIAALVFALLSLAVILGLSVFNLRFKRVVDEEEFGKYKETFFRLTLERECKLRWALYLTAAGLIVFVLTFLVITLGKSVPLL